jgi:hypothetical protein
MSMTGLALLWLAFQEELWGDRCHHPHGSQHLADLLQRSRELDAEFKSLCEFIALREPTLQALDHNEISLREACERVQMLGDRYPNYLQGCGHVVEGKTLREKLARVLLLHFQDRFARTGEGRCRARALYEEFASAAFQEWCR